MKFFLILLAAMPLFLSAQKSKKDESFYQITIYHFTTAEQENLLDNYFKTSMLPAFHKFGIESVGVFKPLANDTASDKTIYTLVPLKSLQQSSKIKAQLEKDALYQQAGKAFIEAAYKQPAFTRKEIILLQAFPMALQLKTPKLQSPKGDHIYELRSYESATDKLHANKVKMFNEGGEVTLFERLGFNAVFYAAVIAGSHMPNLMYMTSFENMVAREEHWKAFGADPEWKKLSALPEYQNNVSHIDITFMKAAKYSDY